MLIVPQKLLKLTNSRCRVIAISPIDSIGFGFILARFHVLQEFDEGKRSCRRRLAGHNKRRRKTNPDPVPNGSTSNDDQTSSYLLISLLKILSNMHCK